MPKRTPFTFDTVQSNEIEDYIEWSGHEYILKITEEWRDRATKVTREKYMDEFEGLTDEEIEKAINI